MEMLKQVIQVYEHGSAHWVGDGFPVRNLIPSSGLDTAIDPFLMLDYAGPKEFAPEKEPRGVGEHPHRGFETVTIAYQGSVEHRDSAGNSGTIKPGEVQWMTAASGVVHEEKHEREFAMHGGTFEMIQLWVNLPSKDKMTNPRYQTLENANIPQVKLGNFGLARVIAGSLGAVVGPAKTFTPVTLIDVKLTGGAAEIEVPSGHNMAVFLLKGKISIAGLPISGEAKLALLSTTGNVISIMAEEESRLLILGGKPIAEPVASYGPFVMNTKAELIQAVEDYQAGRMGHLSVR